MNTRQVRRRIKEADALIDAGQYREALPSLHQLIEEHSSLWQAWHMAGKCYVQLDEMDAGIEHIARASSLNPLQPILHYDLGLAFQLNVDWEDSILAFHLATVADPDFEMAYNAMASSQAKLRQWDKALYNCDVGIKALARRIVKRLRNSRRTPLAPYRETVGRLWVEYASYAAKFLTSTVQGLSPVLGPTDNEALRAQPSRVHGGLYWIDETDPDANAIRRFLPNCFNAFRESLRGIPAYPVLLGNSGILLQLLECRDDATKYLEEAQEFLP